ncbi:MAG: MATE family efflux transporter, partial [Candidatus Sumerlaeota bacterium]
IRGAAIATVISFCCGCTALTILFLSPSNSHQYGTRINWRPDPALMKRLLRFGLPNGAHFFLDISAFTLFILLVGRLGETQLAATNMTFRINLLLFLPMIGFGIATSALVGRYLGAEQPDLSERATWSAFHLTVAYMSVFAFFYVVTPRLFLLPFSLHADPDSIGAIMEVAIVLMRFIAVYSLFDTMQVIFSSALRGAGDTRFVMRFSVITLWLLLVLPVYLIIHYGGTIYWAWVDLSLAIAILGCGMLLRFIGGKWRDMRVIGDEDRLAGPPMVLAAEEGVIYSEVTPD